MADDKTPSKDDVLAEIEKLGELVPTNKPEPVSLVEKDPDELSRELAFAKLRAFKDHHNSKKDWSGFLMGVIFILVMFQIVLLCCVGTGTWDFTKYEWLLPALLVQNFAQMAGLAWIVVKALFDNFKE